MTKILIDEATVKLALEALKQIDNAMPFPVAKLAQAALQEALAEQPAHREFVLPGGGYVPAIPAQQALDKKAENARELGLDYEPAQQEYERGVIDGMQEQMRRSVDRAVNAIAQRTWVGLTDDEKHEAVSDEIGRIRDYGDYADAIEAKLKEKNT